ncbi:MAG: cytochrome c3 family protein [Desulfatitalea sp.]
MTSKKHRLIMYGVAVQLLLIAIVCYAAFPVPVPEEPIRLMYQTNAGKVLFDHQTHASVKGYSLACTDCHHPHGGEEIAPVSCGMCHPPRPEGSKIPESCLDCHSDEAEIEKPEIMKRSDAFHAQCIQCHEQYGKGPQSGADNCSKCHVL